MHVGLPDENPATARVLIVKGLLYKMGIKKTGTSFLTSTSTKFGSLACGPLEGPLKTVTLTELWPETNPLSATSLMALVLTLPGKPCCTWRAPAMAPASAAVCI